MNSDEFFKIYKNSEEFNAFERFEDFEEYKVFWRTKRIPKNTKDSTRLTDFYKIKRIQKI